MRTKGTRARFRFTAATAVLLMVAPALPRLGAAETCNGHEATIVGTEGNDTLTGTDERDVIVALGGDDSVDANGGDDVVCDGPGRDGVRGGRGNDVVVVGDGEDALAGGRGPDTISFLDQVPSVKVDLFNHKSSTEGGETDRIRHFRHIIGSEGDDVLKGDRGDGVIVGRGGDDFIRGRRGNDRLFGKSGTDSYQGGRGSDLCEKKSEDGARMSCERHP